MTFFLITAAISVIAAFGVIFNRNVVHSALSLLVNFAAIAVLYFTLNAQFLGVAQILVYAGAIVVLFLFVVMLLGADLGEAIPSWMTVRNVFLVVLGLILLTILGVQFIFVGLLSELMVYFYHRFKREYSIEYEQ